ncbi:hypothetical protein LTR37_017245 [Vermiconidia calcicola]|uniref:Uncharacterized protein n=1 Tax=Vermiconidia calcicola TaxID=1690605 RepID=A0ACC3MKL2_9PEZI|nr:hypothetical protein LTR37_017245 [Vermiconidia calcicola]
MARNYCWLNDAFEEVAWEHCPEAQGAGSIFTSVNDYIRWVKAMMRQESPVVKEIYDGLTKTQIVLNPEDDIDELAPHTSPETYDASLGVYYYRGQQVVKHDGQIPGLGSCHFFLLQFKFGGVILANSDSASELGHTVSNQLIDEVLDTDRTGMPSSGDEAVKEDGLRKKLCPDTSGDQIQEVPLSTYTGQYQAEGYHGVRVETRTTVSSSTLPTGFMAFNLTFEHVCDQRKYIAHLSKYLGGGDQEYAAEFRFEGDMVVGIGTKLEDGLDEMIWFKKMS